MSLTAFIPVAAPQILPFIGTPGAATVGHALVWSETPQGFTLAPITVGPDQFLGVLPVSKGGWGTTTGSFTSPGAITLTAGGANQGITLQPSGTGTLNFGSSANPILGTFNLLGGNGSSGFNINLPATTTSFGRGIYLQKGEGYFAAINRTGIATGFVPTFVGRNQDNTLVALQFLGQSQSQSPGLGAVFFAARDFNDTGGISPSGRAFYFANGYSGAPNYFECLLILGNGDSTFFSTTESTSTTTGAVRINGGLGVAKSLYAAGAAGSRVNFASLPTSSTGLNSGDLWRDSNGFLRIV